MNGWEWGLTLVCVYIIGFLVVGRAHRWAWNEWIRYDHDAPLSDNMTVLAAMFWPIVLACWMMTAVFFAVAVACKWLHDGTIVHNVAKLLK